MSSAHDHGHTPSSLLNEAKGWEPDVGHTPGPWTIVEYSDGDSLAIHSGDSANRICFMAMHGGSEKQWRAIQANAALISAAPALLKELDRLVGETWACIGMNPEGCRELWGNTNYRIVCDRIEASRAAISKATQP